MNRKQREFKRMLKAREAQANEVGRGGFAAARRRRQMLKGSLKPENGLVKEYACDNHLCQNTVKVPGLCSTCVVMTVANTIDHREEQIGFKEPLEKDILSYCREAAKELELEDDYPRQSDEDYEARRGNRDDQWKELE
jgi:hypothetical protein